jgi:Hpt domain
MNREEIQYVYSGRFDTAFLNELYAEDVESAAEVFESSLKLISSESINAEANFRQGDIESLRKLFHKIKPLFGYVGLLKVQELVQHFENACHSANNIEELRKEYDELNIMINESVNIIRQELIRMKMFLNVRA